MTETIYFLGRFHVLLLHLPIGILLLAVVLEFISRRERFRSFAPAVTFVWLAGAVTAVATVLLGYMHASEGGFDNSAINAHRIAGTSLALLAVVTWALRYKSQATYAKAWPVLSTLVAVLLVVTGHFGGNLTHGDTYLAQYAPASLRGVFGVTAEQLPRPKPKDVASADIYWDVVAPALNQRCGSCHNDSKRKGGLSAASYAMLMKGGDDGKVIVPGAANKSDLFRRINLPHDHDDFMPHDGKTPLTPEQTALIGWWIEIGAPHSAVIASLQPTPEAQIALENVLGFGSRTLPRPASQGVQRDAQLAGAVAESFPEAPSPDTAAIGTLESNGFIVRPLVAANHLLQVDFGASRPIKDADFAELAKLGQNIYSLNLRNAGVVDAQLQTVAKFDNLVRLRLELNPITDAGVSRLSTLKNLKYLNLYGTKITNRGIAPLANLNKLRELFVWQTGINDAGIAEFKRSHANASVDQGFDPKVFPEGPKVIPVVN